MADRMFHSMKNAWESASRENMSDVRELTPEFFYLPEFLTNCNALEFGEWSPGEAAGPRQGRAVSRSSWVIPISLLSIKHIGPHQTTVVGVRPPLGGST